MQKKYCMSRTPPIYNQSTTYSLQHVVSIVSTTDLTTNPTNAKSWQNDDQTTCPDFKDICMDFRHNNIENGASSKCKL